MTFHRTCTLDLQTSSGGFRVRSATKHDLRVAFDVARDRSRDPDSAVITVWGLAPSSCAQLENSDRVFATLTAGYETEGEHQIFSGVLLNVHSGRDGASWATTIELGDEAEQRTALARIHRQFPIGMTYGQVLTEIVKSTGLKGGDLALASASARVAGSLTLKRPLLVTGQAIGELSAFCRSIGFSWKIQDGAVVVLGLGAGANGSGPLLSIETGLEAAPSVNGEGLIQCMSRLVPDLVPGRAFSVVSTTATGIYVATATKHLGDTHGAAWTVQTDGEPLAASVAKGLVVDGLNHKKAG